MHKFNCNPTAPYEVLPCLDHHWALFVYMVGRTAWETWGVGKHLFTGLAAAWETWGCLEAFTYKAWPPTWENIRCLAALVYRAWPPDWENIWCLGAFVPRCPEFVPCLKWPPWVNLHARLKEFIHSSRWSHIWGVPPLSPFCPRPRVRIRGSLTEFHDLPLSGLTFYNTKKGAPRGTNALGERRHSCMFA